MRHEALVWSCQESCEKPLENFKKGGVTEADLPFRKIILRAGWTIKVSQSSLGSKIDTARIKRNERRDQRETSGENRQHGHCLGRL